MQTTLSLKNSNTGTFLDSKNEITESMKSQKIILVLLILSALATIIGAIYVLHRNRTASHYWFLSALISYGVALLLFSLMKIRNGKKIEMK